MSTDLYLTNRSLGDQADDRTAVDIGYERGDLQLVSDRENLAQAILNRLLTRQGETRGPGTSDYGSRLYQLVGEPNTRRARYWPTCTFVRVWRRSREYGRLRHHVFSAIRPMKRRCWRSKSSFTPPTTAGRWRCRWR